MARVMRGNGGNRAVAARQCRATRGTSQVAKQRGTVAKAVRGDGGSC